VTKIAKIDYINLLPFTVFIKQKIKSERVKQSINYKKSYPSKINKQFKYRKIDSAFISSIETKQYNKYKSNLGIVAHGEVWSVLSYGNNYKLDKESSTSNKLAKILNIDENIIIGDKALKLYFENNHEFKDLSLEWYKKYKLPFVFAVFCYHKDKKFYEALTRSFIKHKIKIPQYILNRYSKNRDISKNDILKYLDKISYQINYKEKRALKLFLKLSEKVS
jgi:chorismate dehydratase